MHTRDISSARELTPAERARYFRVLREAQGRLAVAKTLELDAFTPATDYWSGFALGVEDRMDFIPNDLYMSRRRERIEASTMERGYYAGYMLLESADEPDDGCDPPTVEGMDSSQMQWGNLVLSE